MGKKVIGYDMIRQKEKTWVLGGYDNCLLGIREDTGKIEQMLSIEDGSRELWEYCTLVGYQELLIAFPGTAEDIVVYNTQKNVCTRIPFPEEFLKTESCNTIKAKIIFAYVYQDRIYAFGEHYPGILVFYPKSGDARCIPLYEMLGDKWKNMTKGYFSTSYVVQKTTLYAVIRDTKYVFSFNLENEKCELIEVPAESVFDGLCEVHQQIWILHSGNTALSVLDPQFRIAKEIQLEGSSLKEDLLLDVQALDDDIYVYMENGCAVVDTRDGTACVYRYPEEEQGCYRVRIHEEQCYRFYEGRILIHDVKNVHDKRGKITLETDAEAAQELLRETLEIPGCARKLHESSLWGLEDFLNVPWKGEESVAERISAGKRIHDAVCGYIKS